MIRIEDRSGVRFVRMQHGKVNAFDLELCEAIVGAFRAITKQEQISSVVLTGSGSAFSAGVDLQRILREGKPYVDSFLMALDEAFRAVYTCSRPVVAAINGHAIAGGCVLAVACDERVAAEGTARIGVPELLVGVNFPPLAREIMCGCLAPAERARVMMGGQTMLPEDARAIGLVDEIVSAAELETRAEARALALGRIAPAAFADLKRGLRAPRLAAADDDAEGRRATIEVWNCDETVERIRSFLEKTIGKK